MVENDEAGMELRPPCSTRILIVIIDFSLVSAFLPSTAETVQYVLAQGGVSPSLASTPDPQFDALLAETRMHLESRSFKRVLDASLEKATEILFDGLERNLFDSAEGQAEPESALGLTSERRVRLAGMLPGLARWCHLALHGFPNDLIDVSEIISL